MSRNKPSLLVVEDDANTARFLAENLVADGFDVTTSPNCAAALRSLGAVEHDLVLLDVNLPDGSGLDLLRRIREQDEVPDGVSPDLPVIVVSGRDQELERLRGFERGADDYLVKPCSYPELRARIGAVQRRSSASERAGRVRVGDLVVDRRARTVCVAGRPVELSRTEFALLAALSSEPDRVFTKQELLRDVWGFRSLGVTRTLDSHACRLRGKLARAGGQFVFNVWGVGYCLIDQVSGEVASSGKAA